MKSSLVAEGAVFLLEDADVLAVTGLDEARQVEFGSGGEDVVRVGEGGGEIEQEAVTAQDAVDVLALGVFFVAFVGFVEQDIPVTVVVVIAEVNDALFLLIAQVVGAIIEDGDLLVPEQARASRA